MNKNQKRLEFALERKHLLPEGKAMGSQKLSGGILDICNEYQQGKGCYIKGKIGRGTVIGHNVIIHKHVKIGKNCYIGSNTVIGERGYSYAYHPNGTPEHIAHTGGVIIGDRVSIGAGVVIARATVDWATIICDDVKIDDLTHIPHNCHIGARTMIVNGVMLGGGCRIGQRCFIGTGARIRDHIQIADGTQVGIGAVVIKDTEPDDVIVGNPGKFLRKRVWDL